MEGKSLIKKPILDSILHNIKTYENKELTKTEYEKICKIANEIGNLRWKYNKKHEKKQSSDEQFEILRSLMGV